MLCEAAINGSGDQPEDMLLSMTPKTKRIALAGCLTLLVVGYGLLLWHGPWWIDGSHLRRKNLEPADGVVITGFRTMLVALGAGAVAACGLYYTHKNHRHTEMMFEHTRAKDREQSEIAREGQVTERYVQAIKLVGSESLTERLGGIYSLERIMRDSKKDHATVVEVLAAFIRQKAEPTAENISSKPVPHLSEDIQAAISVLGRRPDYDKESILNLDVRRVFNNGIHGVILQRVELAGAHLNGAHLSYANLTFANFTEADLRRVELSGAKCANARFRKANLQGSDLSSARLTDADFTGANLTGANLSGASLNNATFLGANLTGADLMWADLTATDFTHERITHWELPSDAAEDKNLPEAQGLTAEQLADAFVYRSTKLPADLASDPRMQEVIEKCEADRAKTPKSK
ncbi:pentapeptide repeat-containing protein [Streptomyces sp. NPDC046197]|uniref:pentapeptide repeat-containing protein n=1 Tax=Streptomyces sp. NPDC046197 TaxID=3154337 RepID=UPI0033D0ACE5